jgi:hypothetical protein
LQQIELVGHGHRLPRLQNLGAIIRDRSANGLKGGVEQAESGVGPSPGQCALGGGAQPGWTEIAGGGVADASPVDQGNHGPQRTAEQTRLDDSLAHLQVIALLGDQTQGPAITGGGLGNETLGEVGQLVHGAKASR